MELTFERGTIAIDAEHTVPYSKWDDRTGTNRAPGFRYHDITNYLTDSGISYKDNVLDLVPSPELSSGIELRPYQQNALQRWLTDCRGVLVLPTGAGKTYIGMQAVEEVNAPAFVVVPTLDLVDQWIEELQTFDINIGEYTGREKQIEPITVSTYDSAYNHAEKLGNQFKLIVFDEVHHLAAEGYRQIAELFAAPCRLGLTATYEREDEKHEALTELLGGKVYEIETEDLTGEYLSEYTVERITVELTPEERSAYDEHVETFRDYLRLTNITMRGPQDFQKVVLRSGSDPRAWQAVRARNEARQIAYNSEGKIDELATLLDRHREDRVIIFTRYNDLVHRVSDRFFIPPITHKTGKDERRRILQRFRDGTYSAIVSSQVLDEGVDVPDANVGIILSGTGSSRQYRQRLGRILRPSGDVAQLYELVSSGTGEIRTSSRRKV
ncbi:DEAD/DEAH box helicase family protein [Salinarchaeum sp. IM2453]|uniref:DEAD/DEAH box helicase family protein n=1 Tax=Salinarchaeum sp. IM2453 TaxID=2862870 RepID=UPI001C833C8A|nr:DEAD/DEAH box helicase family protein [Salinarchaeum sp. IM2453]QZA88209.1 DEAD/DEAH box helicase family protein [Salinarchaeum sp. IM2453]